MTPPLAAWGVAGDAIALPGGHRNTVLRVGPYVFKTTRRSEAALLWLDPVQDIAARCGLHAPHLIPSQAGALKVDGWTCEPFCEGVETARDEIIEQIGTFHRLATHIPQRPEFCSSWDLLDRDTSADIDLSVMPADLVAQLRRTWRDVAEVRTVIHADLNPSNVLTDTQGRITLIDWDEARVDAPVFDLGDMSEPARVAWEIACCWQIEPAHARKLAAGFMAA